MSLVAPNAPAGAERRKQRGLRGFFQKYFTSYPDTPASSAPASRASPASSIRATARGATSRGTTSPSHSPTASRPVTPLRSHHPPSGVTVADRPITQPRPERRRRRRRRTQSPVGLPIYSERPTEDEMSLFKSHDDAFGPSRIIVGIDEEDGDEGVEEISDDEDGEARSDEEQDELGGEDGEEEGADSFFAMPPRQSFETTQGMPSYSRRRTSGAFAAAGSEDTASRPTIRGRPRAASEPLGHQLTQQTTRSSLARSVATNTSNSPYLHGSSSPFASRSGLIELPPRPPSPPQAELAVSVSSTTSRFSFRPRHRSSRSSPIIPPSASSPVLPSSASTSSFLGSGRPRSSTLQKLMSSSAGTSSASLAPPNAFETNSAGPGRNPYGSLGSRASSSQVSLGGRSISAPLANSFVHSSFVFPKTGPTPEQVAFISSRQAIGAYGYGAGASPPPPLSMSPPEGSALPPPVGFGASAGHASSDGLIAPVPVRGRARSGSGASQMSAGASPLSREVRADAPAQPVSTTTTTTALDSDSTSADLTSSPLRRGPASPPPELPPLSPLEGFSDLALAFENRVEAFERAAAETEGSSGASSSRRRPPDITTSAPTPTASAAPSPRLPSRTSFSADGFS